MTEMNKTAHGETQQTVTRTIDASAKDVFDFLTLPGNVPHRRRGIRMNAKAVPATGRASARRQDSTPRWKRVSCASSPQASR